MAILSRKSCAEVLDRIESRFTRTRIERLFYEAEVPNHLIHGSSKAELLLHVFRRLEDDGDYDRLLKITNAAMKALPPEDQKALRPILFRDGFVFGEDDIVPEESLAREHKTALERLVETHGDKLSTATLLHHLREAEELFRLEKWDASVGQARNFVEQLLTDLAKFSALKKHQNPDLSRPVKIRDYLQSNGFFDEGERKKLVDGVYGYFSDEGSHPGIGRQSTARVCLSILWNFGFYVLEKVEAGAL